MGGREFKKLRDGRISPFRTPASFGLPFGTAEARGTKNSKSEWGQIPQKVGMVADSKNKVGPDSRTSLKMSDKTKSFVEIGRKSVKCRTEGQK